LLGYTLGQLIYGPLTYRYGSKKTLSLGIVLQIIASLLCVKTNYHLLCMARFFVGLGAGVGLKMTFTLVNTFYAERQASKLTSLLTLAFSITPALGVTLGGFANAKFGWQSCFYICALYGTWLLICVQRLKNLNAAVSSINIFMIGKNYYAQCKSLHLIRGSLLIGCATSFVYVYAALAPFLAAQYFGYDSSVYGLLNLIPALGMLLGSLSAAFLTRQWSCAQRINFGIKCSLCGAGVMFVAIYFSLPGWVAIFFSTAIIYFGISFIIANAATLTMQQALDKSNASSMMNFINIGFTTLVVMGVGALSVSLYSLPVIFLCLGCMATLLRM